VARFEPYWKRGRRPFSDKFRSPGAELVELFAVACSTRLPRRAAGWRTRAGARSSRVSSHIFVDESKRAGYVIAAVTVTDTDTEATRKVVRAVVLPGQRRIIVSALAASSRTSPPAAPIPGCHRAGRLRRAN
jgi:hypothetical protein